jgi:hypothetical protein
MSKSKELLVEILRAEELEGAGKPSQAKLAYERIRKDVKGEISRQSRKFSLPFGSIVTGIVIASTNLIGGALIGAGSWYLGGRAADSLCCFDLQNTVQRAENGIDRCIGAG